MKFRQATQGTPTEQARRDLRAELLRKEAKHQAEKEGREYVEEETVTSSTPTLAIEAAPEDNKRKLDADEDEEDYEAKKQRILDATRDIDADSASSSSEDESEEDSDDDDDEAALQRELAKIKAERAEAAAREANKKAEQEEEQRERDIALGNPLLNSSDYGIKRRWDDDVVFKNQARGTEERGKEKRFVNDLLRSDFHKRFMDKYVR